VNISPTKPLGLLLDITAIPPAKMVDFEYQPLDSSLNQIRLVHLQKAEGFRDTEIRCRIQHVCLDQTPQYEALSYAWGSSSERLPIYVDGKIMLVTRSLYDALHQFSHSVKRAQPRTLWIDAVCINQADDIEKSIQVQRMGMIYKLASQVVVWLGKEYQSSNIAMRHLHFVGIATTGIQHVSIPQWVNPGAGHPKFQDFSAWANVQQSLMRNILKARAPFTLDVLEAVEDLSKRDWWSRVWIVQEVALGRTVIVQCGPDSFPWECLENISKFIKLLSLYDQRLVERTYPSELPLRHRWETIASRVTPPILARASFQQRSAGMSLPQLIWMLITTGPMKATDPRDKIFGLLAITSDSEEMGITADYTNSVPKLYEAVTWKFVRKLGPNYLTTCCHYEGLVEEQMPSWVQNFTSVPWSPFQPLYNAPEGQIFDASLRSRHQEHGDIAINVSTLQLKAVLVGTIGAIGYTYLPEEPNPQDDCEHARAWLSDFEKFASSTCAVWGRERYNTAQKVIDFRWKVPIADTMLILANKRRAFDHLAHQHKVLIGPDPQGRAPVTQEYRSAMKASCTYRCHFVLSSGYIGLGPTTMTQGDQVFIVVGADVPFVLRPKGGGKYAIVGDAYVHGAMDGEFVGAGLEFEKIDVI
jgi:hypothetical protein